jgi:tetratricopeptide (TPR) repeat protein
MNFELKSISEESIAEALAKVERYRLLNEPALAESICLDVLAINADHQQALISLLLARTDQFHSNAQPKDALEVLARIKGDYEQAYYAGIVWERLGHARIRQGNRGARISAYRALQDAMNHYERAIKLAPHGNHEATLRWNTCARTIMQNPDIQPLQDDDPHSWMHDEVGPRIVDA